MILNRLPMIAHECAKSTAMNFMADGKDDLVTSSFVYIMPLWLTQPHTNQPKVFVPTKFDG
jgi:hypothetical protein